MITAEVSFHFKARYCKLGELNANTKEIWFVLHGYGQLAAYFVQKFKLLTDHHICVIAPEGLSHFYKEGFTGRVGATWMTKENRLMDIDNYIAYLNTVYHIETQQAPNLPVTMLGFSQGAATVSRWIAEGNVAFERLILWAGLLPPDMDIEKGHSVLRNKQVDFVYGKSDPLLSDARFEEMNQLAQKLNIQPQVITFDGDHSIDQPTLKKLITPA